MSLCKVLHQLRASGRVTRREQQVNVVRHQAISVDHAAEPRGVGSQSDQVRYAIIIVEETSGAVVPSLDDMQGNLRDDETRRSRHSTLNGVSQQRVDRYSVTVTN